jgi:hypothetical protein
MPLQTQSNWSRTDLSHSHRAVHQAAIVRLLPGFDTIHHWQPCMSPAYTQALTPKPALNDVPNRTLLLDHCCHSCSPESHSAKPAITYLHICACLHAPSDRGAPSAEQKHHLCSLHPCLRLSTATQPCCHRGMAYQLSWYQHCCLLLLMCLHPAVPQAGVWHALLWQLLLLLLPRLLLLRLPLPLLSAVCPLHNSCSCVSASFICCFVSCHSIACRHTDGP